MAKIQPNLDAWQREWRALSKPMNQRKQQACFAGELKALVDRYAAEFDLDAVAAIGILTMQIRAIQDNVIQRVEGGEEPPQT